MKQEKDIYFTKIQFTEYIWHRKHGVLYLNLQEKELAYQVYGNNRNMPAIEGVETEEWFGKENQFRFFKPAKIISNAKTNFKPELIEDEFDNEFIVYSYSKKLNDEELTEIKKFCKVSDFDPFRNREMNMEDEGFAGYRDGMNIRFDGISDSYFPYLRLPMNYYYDSEHEWPSETLYKYLVTTFLMGKKNLQPWIIPYGAFSLPG